jgi:hypothetical protein
MVTSAASVIAASFGVLPNTAQLRGDPRRLPQLSPQRMAAILKLTGLLSAPEIQFTQVVQQTKRNSRYATCVNFKHGSRRMLLFGFGLRRTRNRHADNENFHWFAVITPEAMLDNQTSAKFAVR